jgi:hypothetical protein
MQMRQFENHSVHFSEHRMLLLAPCFSSKVRSSSVAVFDPQKENEHKRVKSNMFVSNEVSNALKPLRSSQNGCSEVVVRTLIRVCCMQSDCL